MGVRVDTGRATQGEAAGHQVGSGDGSGLTGGREEGEK